MRRRGSMLARQVFNEFLNVINDLSTNGHHDLRFTGGGGEGGGANKNALNEIVKTTSSTLDIII